MALLQRLQNLLVKPVADPAVAALYRRAVEQTRQPVFYQTLAVPDSIDGRFDLLVLHVYLLIRRLNGQAEFNQQLFDIMFADMERSLREMGVGDMGIGKRMKPMISAFYGRAQAYEKALAENDDALGAALKRNIYGGKEVATEILRQLTDYIRRVAGALEGQALENLLSGQAEFPMPVKTP